MSGFFFFYITVGLLFESLFSWQATPYHCLDFLWIFHSATEIEAGADFCPTLRLLGQSFV